MCARDWLPLSIPSINPAAQLPGAELGLARQRLRQSPVSKTGSASLARRLGPAGGSRGGNGHGRTEGSDPRGGCEGLGAGLGGPVLGEAEGGSVPARSGVHLWAGGNAGTEELSFGELIPQSLPCSPPRSVGRGRRLCRLRGAA